MLNRVGYVMFFGMKYDIQIQFNEEKNQVERTSAP